MPKMTEYRVLRAHDGDRWYGEGETRAAVEAEVKHLIPQTLEPIGPVEDEVEEKAKPAPENKAEAAPANKTKGK